MSRSAHASPPVSVSVSVSVSVAVPEDEPGSVSVSDPLLVDEPSSVVDEELLEVDAVVEDIVAPVDVDPVSVSLSVASPDPPASSPQAEENRIPEQSMAR
jgi:hypothetical protein